MRSLAQGSRWCVVNAAHRQVQRAGNGPGGTIFSGYRIIEAALLFAFGLGPIDLHRTLDIFGCQFE
jgi:hypothetical protein